MFIIMFIIALVAALWTIGVAVGYIQRLGQSPGLRDTTHLFGGFVATIACLVITIWLFQWAIDKRHDTDRQK